MSDEQVLVKSEGGSGEDGRAEIHAIAPAGNSAPVTPLDLPAEQFRAGLDRRKENRRALMEWVRGALVDSVDFGCIPTKRGPSKPSLWKPGAEKICGMLGVTVHMPTLHDYEQAALHGVQLQHVIIRCELHDAGGRVVADGVGARSLKQDAGDLNKALKMAQKSAHIDATLRMAGLSEVFTQDLEDMAASGKASPEPQPAEPSAEPAFINEAQRRRLEARISEFGLDRERVKDWLRRATANRAEGPVEHFRDLPVALYERLDAKLEEWAEREAIQAEGAA
ncbi:MAG: hypothetical protein FKY71_04690 [Spiribacter salinus]|uniref:Uncharacterized protein n=1 Tax=Spiribacter salinus TaxID=1335746 RepID=A0A540VTY3_9GAMM|nr:MAG: hypothetical protein FKY71_04690 [Spiribacter salinus]